jgi:hypothetical protein
MGDRNISKALDKFALFYSSLKIYAIKNKNIPASVADPDPGSGAFLTPGSGIRNRFFPDPGSRIPNPKTIFLRAF